MVVKFMVPFWFPIIIRHLIFIGYPKKYHNFDNHYYLGFVPSKGWMWGWARFRVRRFPGIFWVLGLRVPEHCRVWFGSGSFMKYVGQKHSP